jgi:hypothetical protein
LNNKILISLNLSQSELELLSDLSEKKEMSKSAILRQALRLMATIEQRASEGQKFYFETPLKEKSEVLIF